MKTRSNIQAEALPIILPAKRCSAAITVSGGKTLLGLLHMQHNYSDFARFLVVAPVVSIFQSWRDEAVKNKLEYLLEHITFVTYLSLTKSDLNYNVVYLDEVHSLIKESHDLWLTMYQGKVLGLSGTPPSNPRSDKWKMVVKHCPIVYTYVMDEAVNDEIINDYQITVHTLELSKLRTLRMKKKDGNYWFTSEQLNYEYWCEKLDNAPTMKEEHILRIMRMKALMGFQSKEVLAAKLFASTPLKVILFANTQEQADRLCPTSYHSKNPRSEENLEKFKSGEITKLSCIHQLSQGVNIPDLRAAIIMHAFSGNSPKTQQRLGRTMRLSINEIARLHILCYKNTVDELWVKDVLKDLNHEKITWR